MGGGSALITVRLFAAAREAAGRGTVVVDVDASTVDQLLDRLRSELGPTFAAVLDCSRVWVNGDEPAEGGATRLRTGDEIAVLPPVSGGASGVAVPARGGGSIGAPTSSLVVGSRGRDFADARSDH